jgi:Phage integrase, N-terminal SAM-like domain
MNSSLSTVLVPINQRFADSERLALAGFLAGHRGSTREAYALDLRQFAVWCANHERRLFEAHRVDIECFGRELEARGRARATIARRLCTIAGFYRYAEEEGLIGHPRQRRDRALTCGNVAPPADSNLRRTVYEAEGRFPRIRRPKDSSQRPRSRDLGSALRGPPRKDR